MPRRARQKAAATPETPAEAPAAAEAAAPSDPRIPAHLLERSKPPRPRARATVAAVPSPSRGASPVWSTAPPAAAGVPVGAGPGGHTQRLLTVVKSGSIQDVKASPVDKVHTWPHLLIGEFVAALAC